MLFSVGSWVRFSWVIMVSVAFLGSSSVYAAVGEHSVIEETSNDYDKGCGFEMICAENDREEDYIFASESNPSLAGALVKKTYQPLRAGKYKLTFMLQSSDYPESEAFAHILVTAQNTEDEDVELAKKDLTSTHLADDSSWVDVSVYFEVLPKNSFDPLTVVLYWKGKGELACCQFTIATVEEEMASGVRTAFINRLRQAPLPSNTFLGCVIAGATLGMAWTLQAWQDCDEGVMACAKEYVVKALVGGALGAGVYGLRWTYLHREDMADYVRGKWRFLGDSKTD